MLLSGDLMVKDADRMASLLVEKVGLLAHPNWRQAFPGHPYVAHFLRAHKSLAVAPTRVEPQGHLDVPNEGDPQFPAYLHSLEQFQGPARPIKTHATVLVTDDLPRVVQRLHDRRLPFRLARLTAEMPFDRLWVGCRPEDPRYEPSVDGGLCIEIMALAPLQIPQAALGHPPPEPGDAEAGALARVVSRGFLVRDLDDVLRRLDENLDWQPAGPIELLHPDGVRRARMGFAMPHSATFDLLEPTTWDGDAGRYLHSWGPGPWYIRLSAHGLEAKAEDLRQRGTRFTRVEESACADGPLLRIEPEELDGAVVEIVEHKAS